MKPTIPNSLSASSMAVQTDNLTKSYDGRNVLDNLGLTVPAGSAYALVGPNGAGKTTTFEVLLDVVRADAGHATVFGQDASGPRLTDCTLFGSFPEPDRHTAASAKPSEFVPHRDFRSNGHYFPHI